MTTISTDYGAGDILIVEDSPTQAALLASMLEARNFNVRIVGDGSEALRRLREQRADVVLSDVLMPGIDGFELCRRIRHDSELHTIPVVLLTELREANDIVTAIRIGASGFLVKPCDEEALMERLYYLLANRQFRKPHGISLRLSFQFAGEEYEVDTEQTQLLDLLFSTFEDALRQKRHLEESNRELRDALGAVEALGRLLQGEQTLDAMAAEQLAGTRVLIVEDSIVQAERLRTALVENGLVVSVAHDGESGLQMAREHCPEIILSDVVMPVMDGYEMCRRIKADGELGRIPVVLLTTLSDSSDIVHGMNAGADFYLTKPCDSDYLLYRLAGVLASARQFREGGAVEPISVHVGGETHEVLASRQQLLDLMISTYENAVQQNRELQRLKAELQVMNANLEDLVAQRTADLMTAKERLEQALADLKAHQQQLVQQERLRALGEMASGIAHDFNNCLSVIMGFTELLQSVNCVGLQREECQQYLELIHTATQDGASVVARLREFYRSRDKNENFEPVELTEILGQVIDLTTPKWQAQALARGISIRIDDHFESVPLISGDAAELREVFTNLIMNAADAMDENGTITIISGCSDGRVKVSVADTGCGMDEITRRRCLEPFYTTKGQQGTGLGLSVTYGIIHRHGGTLEVASELGKGTCITVSFSPAVPVIPDDDEEVPPESVRPQRILVVEDNTTIREMLCLRLADQNHHVVSYETGTEALANFEADVVDLAIIDRAMPGMNGDRLAAELKRRQPHLPIIMLTGFGAMMAAVGERPQGVDMVLAKPVNQHDLIQAIAKLTAQRDAKESA